MHPAGHAFAEGMLLRGRHRWTAAARAFARAADLMPDHPESHFWLAASLDNADREAEAIPAYRRALSLGLPDDLAAKAWTWLASSLSKTGQHAEAAAALTEAAAQGGYEPREEYERIRRQIARRSRLTPAP